MVRESVLRACLELLVEGKVELPIAEVAERSGVNRGTVYRWWPTQATLLNDAVSFHWDYRIKAPETGSWAGDVRVVLTELASLADEPVERAIMATWATGRYPDFNHVMMRAWRNARPHWFEMVGRAIGRGEVSPDVDPAIVLSMMMAPHITKSLFEGRAMTPQEVDMLAILVCRATAPKDSIEPTADGVVKPGD